MGGASPDAATQQAMEACASLRPQFDGRGGPGAGGGGGGDSTAYKAFTSCLKDHGVVLPTASPGASPGGARGLDTADPKAAKAYETCRALLPERSASPSATTG
jgi:hypothetical protein